MVEPIRGCTQQELNVVVANEIGEGATELFRTGVGLEEAELYCAWIARWAVFADDGSEGLEELGLRCHMGFTCVAVFDMENLERVETGSGGFIADLRTAISDLLFREGCHFDGFISFA